MVTAIPNCGREYPSTLDEDHKERPLWEWVPCEMREAVEGENDTVEIEKGKPLACGQVSVHERLVLLCPTCLHIGGRKW